MLIELHTGAQTELSGRVTWELLGGGQKGRHPSRSKKGTGLGPLEPKALGFLEAGLVGNWGLIRWGKSGDASKACLDSRCPALFTGQARLHGLCSEPTGRPFGVCGS